MKRQLRWSLFIFGVIFLAFFGMLYLFLSRQGFGPENYQTAVAVLFPAALVVGYVFLTQLLEHQERQEERLEHLVREVLHEINLPLATIEANLEMLRKTIPSSQERSRRRLERISAASRRLKKLYRELAYNIRREIMPVEKERFDVAELVEERLAFFRGMRRNSIRSDLQSFQITADRIGFEQVVDNLMENALKYSDSDTAIDVTLARGRLTIRDRGIGMDENEILRIFERYYQSDSRRRGEGIGLSIVKRYCDENGVDLKLRSRKGEGTTVTLYFPAEK